MSNSFLKNTAYSLLDLVTLKKGISRTINNMKVRFPPRWSRYYENDYEKDNYEFIMQEVRKGMHIIDIGAHIGLFTVVTSRLTGPNGKVVCFEPTPGTNAILKDTLKRNKCYNVIVRNDAVGGKAGKATFYISNELEGCNDNSLVLNKEKTAANGYEVTVTTIDTICKDHSLDPAIIKIDAEGAEQDVLKGASYTLQHHRPLIILGLHPNFIKMKGDSLQGIWDIINANRYKIIYDNGEMNEKDFVSQKDLFDVRLIPAH